MATETTAAAAQPMDTDTFVRGLWRDNPVFVQVLGMCPVLAVSNTAMNALAMGLAATFVLVLSSALVSALRRHIPKQVRIATFILIIATFVTIVDFLIQAISLDVHKALGAFIALIVVNCMILGRAEAFASKNSIGQAVLDAGGMGLGFTLALLCLGVVREVLGSGTLFEVPLFGAPGDGGFQTWSITLLPGGGFFTLGLWLLVFAGWAERRKRRLARREEAAA
jgi:electron transport complex protein RnfE